MAPRTSLLFACRSVLCLPMLASATRVLMDAGTISTAGQMGNKYCRKQDRCVESKLIEAYNNNTPQEDLWEVKKTVSEDCKVKCDGIEEWGQVCALVEQGKLEEVLGYFQRPCINCNEQGILDQCQMRKPIPATKDNCAAIFQKIHSRISSYSSKYCASFESFLGTFTKRRQMELSVEEMKAADPTQELTDKLDDTWQKVAGAAKAKNLEDLQAATEVLLEGEPDMAAAKARKIEMARIDYNPCFVDETLVDNVCSAYAEICEKDRPTWTSGDGKLSC